MYSLRDDTNIDVNRHKDLLHQSAQRHDNVTPLKTMISKSYKSLLAYAGKKMMYWGYRMQQKSGVIVENPLPAPPYSR